jgi:hypothetical protein
MDMGKEYPYPRSEQGGDVESLVSFERQRLAETFGATPLIKTDKQNEVYDDLLERIVKNRPQGLSEDLFHYVLYHFELRFAKRQQRNTDSYRKRLEQDDSIFDIDQLALVELARRGLAFPGELLDVRQLLGMGDIELGRVTHPYGEHLEDLEELRLNTRQAILDRDGELFPEGSFDTFEIEDTDRATTGSPTVREALLVVRTRPIGKLPDGTIIRERSSFILKLDEVFNGKVILKIKSALFNQTTELDQALAGIVAIDEVAAPLLETYQHTTAIPLSSTIYAVNEQTQAIIHDMQQTIHHAASANNTPPPQWFLDAIAGPQKHVGYDEDGDDF